MKVYETSVGMFQVGNTHKEAADQILSFKTEADAEAFIKGDLGTVITQESPAATGTQVVEPVTGAEV